MDAAITHWINAAAGSHALLDNLMIAATRFGVPVILLAVVVQWWSRANRYHIRHAAISAGLSVLLGLAINQAILLVVHRIRPYDAGVTHLLIERSRDWSFPSDHATASFAVAATFATQRLPRRTAALLVLALLVSLSRIYLGTHYLTDVLGGAVTGALGALLVRMLYREKTALDRLITRIL